MRGLILLFLFAQTLMAQETVKSPTPVDEEDAYAPFRNFLSAGLRAGPASNVSAGPMLYYGFRLTDNLIVGTTLSYLYSSSDTSGGSLDTAQYYKNSYSLQRFMIDANATYFFRDHGYARWGFLMRGGIGHAHSTAKLNSERYDRDPGFFTWGDGKRLLDTTTVAREWDSTYVRLGGYYQFAWGMRPTRHTGHILQLGMSGMYFDTARDFSLTQDNGTHYRRKDYPEMMLVDVSYVLAF